MRKSILAGALSIAVFSTGFGYQAQAQAQGQGNLDISNVVQEKQLFAATSNSQVQVASYQDIYKMLLLSKLAFKDDQMALVTTKNSITVKISLKAIWQSYEDGTNLYPEGEAEFKKLYEEYKKVFGESIQLRFVQSGKSFKAEIYGLGSWHAISGKELEGIYSIFNRADYDLKAGGYFTDAIGHWSESYIQFLYQLDIVNGTSATTFNPNGQVTRGQLAKMIFNATGLDMNEEYEGPATYKDLNGFWGAKEVAVLQDYGLIDIFKGDQFQPNKKVTREEMAHVTASYLIALDIDPNKVGVKNTFVDKAQMSKDTVDSIGLLQQLSIIEGVNGKFNPKGNITRAQFSKIMTLSIMKLVEEE
ncbi:MAG: S-layer homology domain-containing protein [Lysinibacillus sp.]